MKSGQRHTLSLEIVRNADATTIVVGGDLDRSSADELREVGIELLESVARLSIDLVATTIIDSAALGVLIELRRNASDNGCPFDVIIGPTYQRTIFDTTGLGDYFRLTQAR